MSTQPPALLQATHRDDATLIDGLVPMVYDELRSMARRQLARERPDHTLQTTELVHEAYLRLAGKAQLPARGRAYFFAAASRAMRHVLVDYARRRQAAKRGGGEAISPEWAGISADGAAADAAAAELLDLNAALERLAVLSPRPAQVVECRYFGGLSVAETAEALGVSPRTVKSDWALARAWLYGAVREGDV